MVRCKKCGSTNVKVEMQDEFSNNYAKAICNECKHWAWLPKPENAKKRKVHNAGFKQMHYDKVGKYICAICGCDETFYNGCKDTNFELDHIIPIHRQGQDIFENTQILCFVCHSFKSSHEQLIRKLKRG